MLARTGPLAQVALRQDVAHLQPHAVVGPAGQGFEVLVPEETVRIELGGRRHARAAARYLSAVTRSNRTSRVPSRNRARKHNRVVFATLEERVRVISLLILEN